MPAAGATLTQSDHADAPREMLYFEVNPDSGETHIQTVGGVGSGGGSLSLPIDVSRNAFGSNVMATALGYGAAATTGAVVLVDPAALTAIASTNIARFKVGSTASITVPAGTTAIAAGLWVDQPSYIATGTITAAASVYIAAPPTTGAANYSLWVAAGTVRVIPTATVASLAAADITALRVGTATITLTGTTQVTTVQGFVHVGTPTLTDASAVTVDQYSTVYIAAAPVAAGSVTLTLGYALHVAAGTTRLSGDVTTGGAAVTGARNTLGYATAGTVVTAVGVGLHMPATSYTDGGGNGTIAVLAVANVASATVLATNVITYSDAASLRVDVPVASTGATFTRTYSLWALGQIRTNTNVQIDNTALFGTTQPVGAAVFGQGTAPVGTLATGGAIYTDGTVMKKIIANGTASNIET